MGGFTGGGESSAESKKQLLEHGVMATLNITYIHTNMREVRIMSIPI